MNRGRGTANAKDPRSVQVRLFRCRECGAKTPACKLHGKTQRGHAKHFWCYVCRDVRKHVQID